MELKNVLCALNSLGRPQEFNVRRDNLLCLLTIDELVDFCGITLVSITNGRESLSLNWLEDSKQRVLLLCLCKLSVAVLGSLIGSLGTSISVVFLQHEFA